MKRRLVACLLLAAVLFCGCTQNEIREDALRETLPAIDPGAGVGRDVDVTLYFRLADEPALVPVQRTVTVRANEYVEAAVIRQLIAGPAALYGDLEPVLPSSTRLLETSREGGILYVTLSNDILSSANTSAAREEAELASRLAVYAVVNSLCALGGANRVQIMVDMDGTGEGTRVPPFSLGFTSSDASSQWLEPMGMEKSVIITPKMLVELALGHIARGEYAQAYPLFAESETGGLQKPDYAAFETQMLSLGTLDSYTVYSTDIVKGQLNGEAEVDLSWTTREDGLPHTLRNVILQMIPEGDLFKIGYYSLLNILHAGGGA